MKQKGTRPRSAVGKTLDEDPLLARELLDLDAGTEDLEPIVYSPTSSRERFGAPKIPHRCAGASLRAIRRLRPTASSW